MPFWAGQSCSPVNDVKPAGDILRDIVRDAEAVIGRLKCLVDAGEPMAARPGRSRAMMATGSFSWEEMAGALVGRVGASGGKA